MVWCRNNIFKATAETDEHFLPHQQKYQITLGEVTTKVYEANKLGLKMEKRLTLKCLENLQMASCSVKETEKPVCLN